MQQSDGDRNQQPGISSGSLRGETVLTKSDCRGIGTSRATSALLHRTRIHITMSESQPSSSTSKPREPLAQYLIQSDFWCSCLHDTVYLGMPMVRLTTVSPTGRKVGPNLFLSPKQRATTAHTVPLSSLYRQMAKYKIHSSRSGTSTGLVERPSVQG